MFKNDLLIFNQEERTTYAVCLQCWCQSMVGGGQIATTTVLNLKTLPN